MSEYLYVYKKVCRKLLKNPYKDSLKPFVNDEAFKLALKSMLNENDFSCKTTLNLMLSIMKFSSNEIVPDDYLYYIYEYLLNKSFPEAVTINLQNVLEAPCELYLTVLRIICDEQRVSSDGSYQSNYPLNFLSSEEEKSLEHNEEYKSFTNAFKHNYIYELMKLSDEIFSFNTLDHVCGVHYLSLFIGRQLKNKGIPIDLGRISGAAAGHDIGKYGCKVTELKRVPYLHYYYTDIWFKKYNITYIKNIALNHSTWDLEFENLSLESLILIYSDFRVKNKNVHGKISMNIFDLSSSFDVILNKLDNVNFEKKQRYEKVYSKLSDFEQYLISIGVNTASPSSFIEADLRTKKNYALLQGSQIISTFKNLSINHNINLMYQLRDEYSLDSILEAARSEKDWKNLREYIRIFKQYSTYLTQNQKYKTIKFLYENLIHPEDDIRRHCAELIGILIASYDEDYRKEIPKNVILYKPIINSVSLFKEYLELLIYPSHRIIPAHRFWLGYSISILVDSFFHSCKDNIKLSSLNIIKHYYTEKSIQNSDITVFLLETIKYIPFDYEEMDSKIFFEFIISNLNKRSSLLRLSSIKVSCDIIESNRGSDFLKNSLIFYLNSSCTKSSIPAENYLRYKLCLLLNLTDLLPTFSKFISQDENKTQEIFLSNLKTATDWIRKKIQIDMLLEVALKEIKIYGMHIAIHFSNLLKVSAIEGVRDKAGSSIIKIMPSLTPAERNEVAIELLRALEIEGHKFTEYIPLFLGDAMLWLNPKELDEIIDDLSLKIKSSNPLVKSLFLKTIGISISNYPSYKERFQESEFLYEKRLVRMLCTLLNGLADYNVQVKQAAFSVLGKDIFGSTKLNLQEKVHIFKTCSKKILTLIGGNNDEELLFLGNSAALNHIYRFISDYTFEYGAIHIPIPSKIAFFPGTFDPYSLSHKEIAKAIRDSGFEVYMAVDEFSWSKKTLPNLIRKNILNMSIADELNIYIYPDNFQTNLSNSDDLKKLRDNFGDSKVYIAVGSDVIMNASSYNMPNTQNSVFTFPHIIFERNMNKKLKEASEKIKEEVLWLTLPTKYSNISSTQIRRYIDENRDISSLVDPLVERYINENGFYQREPLDKSLISSLFLKVEVHEEINQNLINFVASSFSQDKKKIVSALLNLSSKQSPRLILFKDERFKDTIIGFSAFHWIRSSTLYEELKDTSLCDYIRNKSLGRIIVIDGIYATDGSKKHFIEETLITETLSLCISKDYEYAIYNPMLPQLIDENIIESLKLCGFTEINTLNKNRVYVVNMSSPCVMNLDIENVLKEPFRSNHKISQTINITRKKLKKAICEIYPGELTLFYDSNIMHQFMINKICEENGVPTEVTLEKHLGNAMCVPYGDILDRYVIPNTVTKALHTEKYFDADLQGFRIGEFPHYLNLYNQVSMLKSFNKPIILVDNLLHKGYRMRALDPLFRSENVEVRKIIVGILSGKGKDLMDTQNRKVDSVYFIPRLKLWLNENSLYPFIGGDSIWRGSYPQRNLLPSINSILPYTYPDFIVNGSKDAIFNLSKTCIENSMEILESLENEYHVLHERNLNISNMGEVFTIPRCPEHGNNMNFDLNLSLSCYLHNDLEILKRYENFLKE